MSVFPIVIIGAGPAGIATAIEAINRGYKTDDIIIVERSGEIAHMISQKYPDEKPILANYKGRLAACVGDMCIADMSKKDFFEYLHKMVEKYNLQIRFNHQVSKVVKLKNGQFNVECLQDTYTCGVIFVAIGNMAAPRTLDILIDPEVNKHLHYDIKNVTLQNKKILVVGGGDSAAEYSKILSDRGHEVMLSYRGRDFIRMIEQNAVNTNQLILDNKIVFLPESQVSKTEAKNDSIFVQFKGNKYPGVAVSGIVVAMGTERPNNYLNSIGISTECESKELFTESKMDGLFFVGDLASDKGKGGTINFAFNSGVHAVAHACDMYLDCPLPAYRKKE